MHDPLIKTSLQRQHATPLYPHPPQVNPHQGSAQRPACCPCPCRHQLPLLLPGPVHIQATWALVVTPPQRLLAAIRQASLPGEAASEQGSHGQPHRQPSCSPKRHHATYEESVSSQQAAGTAHNRPHASRRLGLPTPPPPAPLRHRTRSLPATGITPPCPRPPAPPPS
jgi:hypothetical protein